LTAPGYIAERAEVKFRREQVPVAKLVRR
jgi:hypothetical protein